MASEKMRAKRRSMRLVIASLVGGASAGILGAIVLTLEPALWQIIVISVASLGIVWSLLSAALNIVVPQTIEDDIPVYVPYSKEGGPIRLGDYGLRMEMFLPEELNSNDPYNEVRLAIDSTLVLLVHHFIKWMGSYRVVSWGEVIHGESWGCRVTSPRPSIHPDTSFNRFSDRLAKADKRFTSYPAKKPKDIPGSEDDGFPLPPRSKVEVTSDGSEVTLKFHNRYFSLSLGFLPRLGGIGLGPLSPYFPNISTNPRQISKVKYGHVMVEIRFRTTFNRWISLFSQSDPYYDWLERMLKNIRHEFSFETVMKYHQNGGKSFL